jgi:uncharacterized integral membrane protein
VRRFGRINEEQIRQWQPRLWARLLLLVAACVYLIAFVIKNSKQVKLHFVLISAKVSLIWLILLSVAIGILAGVLLSQLHRRRGRRD